MERNNERCRGCQSERIDHAVACPLMGRVIAAGKCRRMAAKDDQALRDYLGTQRVSSHAPRNIKLRSEYWPTLADPDGVAPILYVPQHRIDGKVTPVMIYGWRTARPRANGGAKPLTDISPRDRYERRKEKDARAITEFLRRGKRARPQEPETP